MNQWSGQNQGVSEVLNGIQEIGRRENGQFMPSAEMPKLDKSKFTDGESAYAEWLRDKSPENMSKVVDAYAPTINSEIMRYSGSKPLLRSRARILAVKAVKSFNPMSGARLQSWIVTNLQPLSRYGQKQRQDVHVPEVAMRQAAAVARVTEEMKDDLGRDPTDAELADELHISVDRVKKVRKMAVPSVYASSLEQKAMDSESYSEPGVITPSQVPFAQEAVYQGLDARDRIIFDSITGSHGAQMTPAKQVAATLGVSPAFVSQRAADIGRQISEVIANG